MENQPPSRPSSGKTQKRRALELLASREGLTTVNPTQKEKALADLSVVGKQIKPSQSGFGKRKSRRNRRSKRTRRSQRK